ncbi:MAG: hypothetical protein K5978_00115 [Campylobacter sp.]|nr:hypothetical protein [Campylobacter sp.]
MREILHEFISIFIVFLGILIYLGLKHKFGKKYDKNEVLNEFKNEFKSDVNAKNLKEILLTSKNKFKSFDKSIKQGDFLALINAENLKEIPPCKDEILSKEFILKCANLINPPLGMALYAIDDSKFLLLILQKEKLIHLSELANKIDESIIICE